MKRHFSRRNRASSRRGQKDRQTLISYGVGALVVLAAILVLLAQTKEQKEQPQEPGFTPEQTAASIFVPQSPSPTPAPTPTPRRLFPQTEQEPDYSFIWFTDTQHYSKNYPETFYAMTEWIKDNIKTYNIKYVFFTGDFISTYNDEAQWAVADKAVKTLDGEIDYFAIAGNHDVHTSDPNFATYLDYFGKARFKKNKNVVNWLADGVGRADAIEIGGTKYLFIGFGYSAEAKGIPWMNEQLKKYSDHNAILLLHDYMTTDGLLSSTGKKVYEQVVVPNPNVFMVLCGHRYNCILLTTEIDDVGDKMSYRPVYNIMMNYQSFENGGDGYLTLIQVYQNDGIITMDTYSPTLNQWYRVDPARSINKEHLVLPVSIFQND
ncbi:metallophosphoesterase [Eubacteriales bacterium OttesenSCG-928-K08]|nr:metallophosphoesterase [Eubacteriales bacterium OttesenSCG-928-K08]